MWLGGSNAHDYGFGRTESRSERLLFHSPARARNIPTAEPTFEISFCEWIKNNADNNENITLVEFDFESYFADKIFRNTAFAFNLRNAVIDFRQRKLGE